MGERAQEGKSKLQTVGRGLTRRAPATVGGPRSSPHAARQDRHVGVEGATRVSPVLDMQ